MRYLIGLFILVGGVGCATGPEPEPIIPESWKKDSLEVAGGVKCPGMAHLDPTALKLNVLFWPQTSCTGTYSYLTCGLSFIEACKGGYLATKLTLEAAQ